jgi:histidine phosphotransferase ChpT
MSDTFSDPASLDPQPAPEPFEAGPTDLAAFVAAKLCHDFISPSGAIVSGLDLLKDPAAGDMHEEALSLIEASARKLVAIITFARIAFGAATTTERFDASELKRALDGVFAHMRAELVWAVGEEVFEKPQARALVNLAYLGGGALPMGGQATLAVRRDPTELLMAVEARGQRARLKPEAVTGLRGERLVEGLAGQWIQPFWVSQVIAEAKGTLDLEVDEDLVKIRVRLPLAPPTTP